MEPGGAYLTQGHLPHPHAPAVALKSGKEEWGASQNREHILFFILPLRSWGFIIK